MACLLIGTDIINKKTRLQNGVNSVKGVNIPNRGSIWGEVGEVKSTTSIQIQIGYGLHNIA